MRRLRRPLFARFYLWTSPMLDRAGAVGCRRRLLAGLTAEVLEVGCGNGLNLAHYPGTVTRVIAVEPEPTLRAAAVEAARAAVAPVEVVDGVAERLPAADGSVDAVVCSLMLCSVADPAAVLAEAYRVLRPGGELRFFEHVRAESPGLRRMQRVVDKTVWPLFFGGCHTGRDTAAAIANAGFTITTIDRFTFPESRLPAPASPHLLGTAVRP